MSRQQQLRQGAVK